MLRTAGYSAPMRHSWRITNQANAFCNLMYTASVCLAGTDERGASMGEGMIVDFDGAVISQGDARPDEIVTGEVRPRLADEARRLWGVENNRGFVAIQGARGIAHTPTCRILSQGGTVCRGRRRSW